jgi:acylphosphatase
MKSVMVRIEGRVQGVGYRAWTEDEARRRGLSGWVRNRRDGAVEAQIAGEDAVVEGMVEAMRHGPALARVIRVSVMPAPDPAPGFHVSPTV